MFMHTRTERQAILMGSTVFNTYRDNALYYHHTRTEHPSADDFTFRSHSHSMCEIYYFLEGNASFVVEGDIHILKKGTLILTDRGQIHNIRIHSGDVPYERTAILFLPTVSPKGFDAVFHSMRQGVNCFYLSESEQAWMDSTLRMLSSPVDGVDTPAILTAVIGIILTKAATLLEQRPLMKPVNDDIVQEIIRFINANLSADWRLDDLERTLFRDKAYLNRRFNRVMGCSIWEYTLRRRVFAAQQHLYLSRSVADAFRISGFQDYSSFYRRYRKYIGLSPSEDLKMMQSK